MVIRQQGEGVTALPRTMLSLRDWAEARLAENAVDEAQLHAELLLAHVLAQPRLALALQRDRPLTAAECARFEALFLRRLAGEPLQYILGETEFMGMRFAVDRRVLIPRPETEVLVEAVIGFLKGVRAPAASVLDIGTGSGNIAVSIAKFLPSARVTSMDISRDALDVARKNADVHGTGNVTFLTASIFDETPAGVRYDVLVSNPPYVSFSEYAGLQREVREFEPPEAVTDGGDGYRFIRRITEISRGLLSSGGALFMEIAYNQGDEAASIARTAGLAGVTILKDHAGHPRVITARAPGFAS